MYDAKIAIFFLYFLKPSKKVYELHQNVQVSEEKP